MNDSTVKTAPFPYCSLTGNFLASKFIAVFKCVAVMEKPISFLSHPTTQLLSDGRVYNSAS
jgi:hypothetical protein